MKPFLDAKGTAKEETMSQSLCISTKTCDSDFCTAIDIENETLITRAIQQRFPHHVVIGEESTGTQNPELLTDKPTWIIDPVDGTTNFASGAPFTCVSIGFCNGGEPVLGVIYAPATKELYLAIKGRGAYRNGIPLKKSGYSADIRLEHSIVCFEFGYVRSPKGIDRMLEAVKRILNHGCRATRSYGSGALDLCYVATGRIDVVYAGVDEEGWKPWDYCAAVVVLNEVGCTICPLIEDPSSQFNFSRSSFSIYSKSMICGINEYVVNQCKRVIFNNTV